ncbi:MAG: hypothetical protein ABH807_01075, partial [Candidatus Shapirobacteria bacterium]
MKQLFYALFFLTPLAMTPFNSELFEFNKMLAVYLLTILIGAVWAVRMIKEKKIIFQRTPLDLFLIIFLLTQILAFFFSIDRHTSFWGYYGRWNGGLLSTFCYLLLYWALVSNLNPKNILLTVRYLLFATAIVALYGITQHFGIDKNLWVQDVQNRVFSTLGQPNWLAAYLAAILPLSGGNFL